MHLIPLPDERRPLLFAHRGCSSLAPENTLAAFRKARELGCPGIELDIHRCASGELVVIHDHTTKRVGGPDRSVEQTDLAALREIDVGSHFAPEFAAERIPLLDELFGLLGDTVYYDIEIKSNRYVRDDLLERELLDLIGKYRLERKVCVSSFNPVTLRRIKSLCPTIPTAIIYCASPDVPFLLRHGEGRFLSGCDYLKPDIRGAGPRSLAFARLVGGRKFIPWTVDTAGDARALLGRGVAGLISNRPQDILPAIAGAAPARTGS